MTDFAAPYRFDLPEALIAQDPAERRGDSRLLLVEAGGGVRGERVFRDLPDVLRRGDLLILNESRVLPARLLTRRADTGGRVEILLVRPVDGGWLAMARPARRLRPGIRLTVGGDAWLEVTARRDDGTVVVSGSAEPATLAERYGEMPLPPYIRRGPEDDAARRARDRERYQTVFASLDDGGAGSVAAPTAGLHFSPAVLERLQAAGVSVATVRLHVGPGTFQPPDADQYAARRLHRESFHLPARVSAAMAATRQAGGRIIAVGTTSLRVLESAARLGLEADGPDQRDFGPSPKTPDPFFEGRARRVAGHWDVAGMTRLFICPPDRVTVVDGLLTNFHLPGSSLLMLVAALAGETTWRTAYDHAVDTQMRFYSYGDCMLILPGPGGTTVD